jgi:hypothetical protein
MPTHTYQQQQPKKRKDVYLYQTPHIPKGLKSKKKWTGKGGGDNSSLKKRQRQRLEAKALKEYQRRVGLLPKVRIKDPQTTKELCQDSLGILEEISEHGCNDHRYLQLSNHLMNIHKKAAENEDNREEDGDFYISNIGSVPQEFWENETPLSPIVDAGSIFDHINPYANMQTNDLIRNYIRLATAPAPATEGSIDVN